MFPGQIVKEAVTRAWTNLTKILEEMEKGDNYGNLNPTPKR
jgi:hypothetical protein